MVTGEGKVNVTPDIAKLSVGIEEQGVNLKLLQDSANKKSQKLVSEFKKLGISEKDIKTTSYNIYPENDYQVSPPKITGYRVGLNYEITIRDFDKVNEAFVVATQNGANIIGGISFDISENLKNDKLNEAREEAVKMAKEKAKGLSKAADITLGKIINVEESIDGNFPRPMFQKSLPVTGGGDLLTQPDIQPGTTEMSLSVVLFYEIR